MPTIDLTGRAVKSIKATPPTRNYIEFGGVHYPGISRQNPVEVTMDARGSHARVLMNAWQRGAEVTLKMQGFSTRAFVTAINVRNPIDGLREIDVTFRPTGAPRGFLASAMQEVADDLAREARNRMPIDTGLLRGVISDKTRRIIGMDLAGPGSDYTALAMRAGEDLLIYGHPNCRCTPVGITTKERPVRIRNKFYVAAPSVTTHSEQDQDNTTDKVHLSMSPNDRSGKWTRKTLPDAIAHAEQMLADNPKLEHVALVKIVKLVRRPKPKFIVEDVK